MTNWIPLHVHDHYSLLDGLSKPKQIADRCKKLNYSACGITNHGSISGAISFLKAMEKAERKWILGNEFYLANNDASIKEPTNRKLAHLCVLARNLTGWKSLIKLTSFSNSKERFYYRPRLSLDDFSGKTEGLITFSGHPGSQLANILFDNLAIAYGAKTVDEAKSALKSNWMDEAVKLAGKYQEIFGKDNFYIEIQLIDSVALPVTLVIADCLRKVAKAIGAKCLATCDAHYPTKQDASDQRALLAISLQTTLSAINKKIISDEDFGLECFFKSNNYHIPSLEEMMTFHKGYENELEAAVEIANSCETYKLANKPMLPNFKCPDGMPEATYLKQLCEAGWSKKINNMVPESEYQKYRDRLSYELDVFNKVGLEGYFLVVQDFVDFARKNEWLVGPGRGSAAGCLVSYLIGITSINPLPYDLLFERFYNAGRNTATRISFPDIDSDFPISKREQVIEYIKNKYGRDCVAQISTFGRMQGRGAVKDVLRVHEACSFDTMNSITEYIPDEAKIADELQEMKEAGEEPSIILWSLKNNADKLKEWVVLKEDGTCDGPMGKLFEQAIRMEGTYRNMGKHAAGIVISPIPLSEMCPMIHDKQTGENITGMEFEDLEFIGLTKYDVLGVACLDKIMGVISLLKTGKIQK